MKFLSPIPHQSLDIIQSLLYTLQMDGHTCSHVAVEDCEWTAICQHSNYTQCIQLLPIEGRTQTSSCIHKNNSSAKYHKIIQYAFINNMNSRSWSSQSRIYSLLDECTTRSISAETYLSIGWWFWKYSYFLQVNSLYSM